MNVTGHNFIQMFLHNKDNLFIPGFESAFGANSIYVYLKRRMDPAASGTFFSQEYALERTEWNKINHDDARCNPQKFSSPILPCINAKLDAKLGCSYPTMKGPASGQRPCEAKAEHMRRLKLSYPYMYGSEAAVLNYSGCLSSCKIVEYFVTPKSELQQSEPVGPDELPNSLLIQLWFPSGRYLEREQYWVYDVNSLFADIGGYLGLLLGHSIYSIFCSLDAIFRVAKNNLVRS